MKLLAKFIFIDVNNTDYVMHTYDRARPDMITYQGSTWTLVMYDYNTSPLELTYAPWDTSSGKVTFTDIYDLDAELKKTAGFVPYPICECGSDKLGHPGHSHWCPLGVRLGRGYV